MGQQRPCRELCHQPRDSLSYRGESIPQGLKHLDKRCTNHFPVIPTRDSNHLESGTRPQLLNVHLRFSIVEAGDGHSAESLEASPPWPVERSINPIVISRSIVGARQFYPVRNFNTWHDEHLISETSSVRTLPLQGWNHGPPMRSTFT
jgi:hypothetical protein